jgi:hypothetical protein
MPNYPQFCIFDCSTSPRRIIGKDTPPNSSFPHLVSSTRYKENLQACADLHTRTQQGPSLKEYSFTQTQNSPQEFGSLEPACRRPEALKKKKSQEQKKLKARYKELSLVICMIEVQGKRNDQEPKNTKQQTPMFYLQFITRKEENPPIKLNQEPPRRGIKLRQRIESH